MAKKRVTLADVAKLAGLSTTAASMILTGRPDTRLSAEAHAKVHEAATQLGYRPNVAARALRTDKSRLIAFISDYVATTRFASGLIRGALAAAEEASKLAGLRYRAGLSNQIVALTAEDSAVALARSVADLEARQLALDIALIRALGGGYQAKTSTGDR